MKVFALLMLALSSTNPTARESYSFGKYKLETFYPSLVGKAYRILQDNKEVFSASPGEFRIISVSGGKQIDPLQPTVTDITGDGIPDLIIEESPRRPGCCWAYSIYSLGPTFREISRLTGFSSPMTFEDVNRNSVYEMTGEDWTFGSWFSSARIVFGYIDGEYRLSTGLMQRTAPAPQTLAAKAGSLRRATKPAGFVVAPEAYQYMLDLVYSGNIQSAWSLLDLIWPKQAPIEKAAFRADFMQQLEKSPYWSQIRVLNRMR